MSAAAMLRSAACRALRRRPSASSFARTLAADEQPLLQRPPTPREMITPRRRLYSSGVKREELPGVDPHGKLRNSGPANLVVPEGLKGRRLLQMQEQQEQAQRAFMTVDEVSKIVTRRTLLLQYLVEEKIKYERLKGLLVRGCIFVGLGIYVKQRFFDGSAEGKEIMTAAESD